MKILITGAAGYIGSVLAENLVNHGYEVVVIDNLVHGDMQNVHPQAKFYKGDISDRVVLQQIFSENKIDAVAHLAALIDVGESMTQAQRYMENNYDHALVLLEEVQKAGIKTFLFSSTAAVYGTPKFIPITETHPKEPINPYGHSKLLFEEALLAATKNNLNFKYAALRFFNACGATENFGLRYPVLSHVIPIILQAAQGRREAFQIYGNDYETPDGTCVRDYVHVSDIADAHIIALKHILEEKTMMGQTIDENAYNIGTGTGNSVKEVFEAAQKIVGKEIPVKYSSRRAGDPSYLVASSEKIQALGWTPKYKNLEDIIKTAWNWQQQHPL